MTSHYSRWLPLGYGTRQGVGLSPPTPDGALQVPVT